jgi:hypothetical protein
MTRWVATRIEMGCDCCSYVAQGSWDRREDVPVEYWTDANIEMDFEEDDD